MAAASEASPGLAKNTICYGAADLALGGAHIRNAPVWVHADDTFPVAVVASAFGVEMGAIIGTNVFRQFLTTIDAPQNTAHPFRTR